MVQAAGVTAVYRFIKNSIGSLSGQKKLLDVGCAATSALISFGVSACCTLAVDDLHRSHKQSGALLRMELVQSAA